MDISIEFRFVTATVNVDYHVYCDNGSRILKDAEEFDPIKEIGNFFLDEGACAVLFENNGKIYLVATNLQRDKKDFVGRPLVFSFCWILQGNNIEYKRKAWCAFSKIILSWNEVEIKIQSLISEEPYKKKDSKGRDIYSEKINFNQEKFMKWLGNDDTYISNFDNKISCGVVKEVSKSSYAFWPPARHILKWEKEAVNENYENSSPVVCLPFYGWKL